MPAGYPCFGVATNASGVPISTASINVHPAGLLSALSIFSDANLTTALANPFTVNSDGTWLFFVSKGQDIRIRVTAPGATTRDIDNIRIPADTATAPQAVFRPEGATFPNTNFPQLVKNSGVNWTDYTLDFDSGVKESAHWYWGLPAGITFTTASVEVFYRLSTIAASTVTWELTTRPNADAATWDTAGTATTATADTVPGVAGNTGFVTFTVATAQFVASNVIQLALARNTGGAAGDVKLIQFGIRLS